MRSKVAAFLAATSFLAMGADTSGQTPAYYVIDLGALVRGGSSMAFTLDDNRLVGGSASLADGTQQAVLWGGPVLINLGTPGLNSGVYGVNAGGQIAISTEIAQKDANSENFCAYGTAQACVAALWQRGLMTALPTLGGPNATIGGINDRGEIAGAAETNVRDPSCPGTLAPGGNGPQLLSYQAVIWGPKTTDIRILKPLPGDTVGMALWINNGGQAVGGSGTCATSSLPPISYGSHAVMWDADGTPHDLGNLGSKVINMALAISNAGNVVGVSAVTDKATPGNGVHAFTWTAKGAMKDLGVLPGDAGSIGLSVNDAGDAVGTSQDSDGNPRAFLWHAGAMFDLNALSAGASDLYLLFAEAINSRAEIVGFGATETGDLHGFLAIPSGGYLNPAFPAGAKMTLTESVRHAVRDHLPTGWTHPVVSPR